MSAASDSPGFASVPPVTPDTSVAPGIAPSPEPANALVAEELEDDPPPPPFDAHGFDPSDYRWIPVKRQRRPDGWSHARQRAFIEALADTGSVTEAAREVGMSITSCYRLRRAPGAGNFAAAWEAAIQQASKRLVEIAFDRAINGVEEPVFDKNGYRVACRWRYNDRLLMFLLRAHQPERYRHAHQNVRHPDEEAPPVSVPLASAISTLEPVQPDAPHRLMAQEELEDALLVADLGNGELPHWHRDPPVDPEPIAAPLGEEFERQLEAAKREAAGLPPGDGSAQGDEGDDDGEDREGDEPFPA